MEHDTLALRHWLNTHGHAQVPIDINEFGAGPGLGSSIVSWGAQVAGFTSWVLCTRSLHMTSSRSGGEPPRRLRPRLMPTRGTRSSQAR
jgi:hypothetical protein